MSWEYEKDLYGNCKTEQALTDRLGCRCLHRLSRIYAQAGELDKGGAYLALAFKRAGETQQFEEYEAYGAELAGLLEKDGGLLQAAGFLEKISEPVLYPKLWIMLLEYKVQLMDWEWLLQWILEFGQRDGRDSRELWHKALSWALELTKRTSGWEKTQEEALEYGEISFVFREYGYYSYAWFLYKNEAPGYPAAIDEGLNECRGQSIFYDRLLLLRWILRYKESEFQSTETEAVIRRIQERLEQSGVEFSEFLPEDRQVLDLVMGGTEEAEMNTSAADAEKHSLVQVRCLGDFCVASGDRILTWRTKKARELFALLLNLRGRGMDRDGLVFQLWPDAAQRDTQALFHTTVTYLRRTLSQGNAERVLKVRDRQYSLDMELIWSDYGRMEEIAALTRKKQYQKLAEPLELLRLYQGEYFASEDYRWLVGKKESVEQMFIQTSENLAEHEAGLGNYDNAVLLLQKLLELNICGEGVLRRLLDCRVRQGDIGGARRQYRKIRDIWKGELEINLPPSFETFMHEYT